jgi:hypothetical protein
MLSEYDKTHLDEILCGHGDWFTAQLLRLIAKSDLSNRARLTKGFPEEVALVNKYQFGEPEDSTVMCENCHSAVHHTNECIYSRR